MGWDWGDRRSRIDSPGSVANTRNQMPICIEDYSLSLYTNLGSAVRMWMAPPTIRHPRELHFCPSLLRKFFVVWVRITIFVFEGVEAGSLHKSSNSIVLPHKVAEADAPLLNL